MATLEGVALTRRAVTISGGPVRCSAEVAREWTGSRRCRFGTRTQYERSARQPNADRGRRRICGLNDLEDLRFYSIQITDAWLVYLKELTNLKRLILPYYFGMPIDFGMTDKSVIEFSKGLPNCNISGGRLIGSLGADIDVNDRGDFVNITLSRRAALLGSIHRSLISRFTELRELGLRDVNKVTDVV